MQNSTQYVDLQVNGSAGVDFNSDHLTVEAMHQACQAIRDSGVAGDPGNTHDLAPDGDHRLHQLDGHRPPDAS